MLLYLLEEKMALTRDVERPYSEWQLYEVLAHDTKRPFDNKWTSRVPLYYEMLNIHYQSFNL